MKTSYLALLVSYFALSAFAQDSTAFIISGTGTVDSGESTPVAPVPGNGDTPDPNSQIPPNQFYPPLASQGYASSKLQDGVDYNSVGPVGTFPNPYQTSNPDPNQTVDLNQGVDPDQTGIPPPPQGTEMTGVVPQPSGGSLLPSPSGPGNGDQGGALASVALASSSSALQDGWTPGVPSITQAPPAASGNATGSGRAGKNGYITTTLAIAIPIPLNASDYDPDVTARIINQFGGAANVRTSVLAVVFGVVGAVAGAVML